MKRKSCIVVLAVIGILAVSVACSTEDGIITSSDESKPEDTIFTTGESTQTTETAPFSSESTKSTESTVAIELEEYKLIENVVETNGLTIRYPQISDIKVTPIILETNPDIAEDYIEYEDFFNPIIADYASNYWEGGEGRTGLTVNYEITYAAWECLSTIFTLSDDTGAIIEKHALVLDFIYGEYNRGWRGDEEAIDYYTENIWNATSRFTIITNDISPEEISTFLSQEYEDFGVFREHFENAGYVGFDTSHSRLWLYYSETGEGWVLLIPMHNDKTDYVEISLPTAG